ncbi:MULTISPECIES: hypothetical protein [Klebsiella]|jgi:hypothetical protein|uniref:hypothetical protein n=1 Tax=Klebsiella TaxID=570 RepID=UPI0007CD3941|nr:MULTISPECIES: hypothetical protein [Klebsiella]MCS5818443.1 hypothetical protein [Klebsiella pneumoniae subsp. pneumoniae]HBQ3201954.1 hypothetical protein [Klebsiella variicola subsp. variicola]HEJ7576698.1 hypothetical protein [Klebsiella michiganensis]AVZ98572.1 hypothetical protein CAY66_01905 [Klebsiella variicola]EIW8764524.1 hypothetical protein [Klebsiella pneumoniae]
MMNKCALIALLTSSLLVAGCSTQAVRTSAADPVPASRILSTKYSTPSENTQKIIVKRDSGSKGALCTSRLSVDGEPVADIKTSEKVELNLPYGEHILSVDLQGMSIMCGKMNTEREIMVSKDKQDEYRIGVTVSAELFIMKTAYK